MPHLVQLDHDGAALGLGLLGVHFGEALDPGLHAGRRHAEQLGGAVHRQAAQVQQHRLDLDPQRHAARRRVGEVQPARLAAVALLAAHEPVLDVLLVPAPLAPQSHPLTSCAVSPSAHIGNLCGPETLKRSLTACGSPVQKAAPHSSNEEKPETKFEIRTSIVSSPRPAGTKSRPGSREEDGAGGEPTTPRDRLPTAEEAFAERIAPLLELVERWRARIVSEDQGWAAVPLPELAPDDPRRLAARIAEELLRARGPLVAVEERVRGAAPL